MHKIIAILVPVVLSGAAKAGEITQHVDLNPSTKDALLRNELYGHTDDARQRALVSKSLIDAHSLALLSPYLSSNPQARDRFYQRAVSRAKADAAIDPWSGGWTEMAVRGATVGVFSTVTAAASPTGFGLALGAGVTLYADEAIQKGFSDADTAMRQRAGMHFTNKEVIYHNDMADTYILNHPELKKYASDLEIGAYKGPAGSDANVRGEKRARAQDARMDQLQSDTSEVKTMLQNAMKDNRVTREEYQKLKQAFVEESKKLQAQAKDAIESMKNNLNKKHADTAEKMEKFLDERAEQQRLENRRDLYTGPFTAMAGLANLFGEPQAAQTFGQTAQLSGTLFDIGHITEQSFMDKPFNCINLYLNAANLVVGLFGGAKQNPEFAALMQALAQIAEQIRELRKEMHARFDRLEYKLDHYFYRVIVDLNKLHHSQVIITKALTNLRDDVSKLQSSLDQEFNERRRSSLSESQSRCLGANVSGGTLRIKNEETANDCFKDYIAIASGSKRLPNERVQNQGTDSQYKKFDMEPFAQLVAKFFPAGGGPTTNLPQFAFGVRELGRLIQLNPKFAPIAFHPSIGFDALIEEGKKLEAFHQALAVKGIGPSNYQLDSDMLKSLVDDYYIAASSVSTTVATTAKAILGRIPHPAEKWNGSLDHEDNNRFPFLKSNVTLCQNPSTQVVMGSWREVDFTFTEHVDRRNHRVRSYNPEAMPVTREVLKLFPQSAMWLEFLGQDMLPGAQLYACLSRAEISQLHMSRAQNTFRFRFTLDLWLTYKHPETNQLTHVWMDRWANVQPNELTAVTKSFDPAWGPTPIEMAWSGKPGSHELNVPIFPNVDPNTQRISSYGIMNAPKQYLARLTDPNKVYPDRVEFERVFAQTFDRWKAPLSNAARNHTVNERRAMESILWQISYVLQHGLDMNDKRAVELYEKIFNKYLLPADVYLTQNVEMTPAQALETLSKQTQELKDILTNLENEQGFKPAVSAVQPYLEVLNSLKSARAAKPTATNWFKSFLSKF